MLLRVTINCPVIQLLNLLLSANGNGCVAGGQWQYAGHLIRIWRKQCDEKRNNAIHNDGLISPRACPTDWQKAHGSNPHSIGGNTMQGLCASKRQAGVDMKAVMRSEILGIAEIEIGGGNKGVCLDSM